MNILFIPVDDLRDLISCLRPNSGIHTPNLDRLAARGVAFRDAHCQAPACAPSRASLLTGTQPASTGCYGFQPMWEAPGMEGKTTLPAWLREHGYQTIGTGKIHHGARKKTANHGPQEHEWDEYYPSLSRPYDGENGSLNRDDPRSWDIGANLHGGPSTDSEESCGDADQCIWAAQRLQELAGSEQPWFLGCGIYRPHLPFICPQKYFDLYDPDSLPEIVIKDDDLHDVPDAGRYFVFHELDAKIRERNLQKTILHSYLACISYMDAQLGRVLDALDKSGQADNTLIMLWGDNGWHFGEKRTWKKFTLWQEATKVPLLIAGPGYASGHYCDAPVGLIDLFPTIADSIGIAGPEQLQGRSLRPLLENPDHEWDFPVITTFGRDNHAVTTREWKYICYFDGSEELYQRSRDQHEWHNLASDESYAATKHACAAPIPKVSTPNAPNTTLAAYFSRDYPDLITWKQSVQKWAANTDPRYHSWPIL